MTSIATDGPIGRAVAARTGRKVLSLELYPSSDDPGVFCIRARLHNGDLSTNMRDFTIRDTPLQKVRSTDLEDCDFTQWPPLRRM